MLTLYFKNGFVLTIRTSGTEPKIKYYAEAISSPENRSVILSPFNSLIISSAV